MKDDVYEELRCEVKGCNHRPEVRWSRTGKLLCWPHAVEASKEDVRRPKEWQRPTQ